ncbi:MAG: response regulator [Candidatus Omnitrophota bacterium]
MNDSGERDPEKVIMVVDDEQTVRDMLSLTLEDAGYHVVLFPGAKPALEYLQSASADLIITDVLMPEMDGYAFYKTLKETPRHADIPVIILTARGAMEDAFEAVGVDAFLEKTAGTEALLKCVSDLIQHAPVVKRSQIPRRILIFGTYPETVDDMVELIGARRHVVETVSKASDVISRTVEFKEDILIMEVQMENGEPAEDVIRAVRLLPQGKDIPILLYSFYRVSELGSDDFRKKILNIEKSAERCITAGGTEYFDRFNELTFPEQLQKYL